MQVRADKPYRLAVGSFVEDYNNKVEIITRTLGVAYVGLMTWCGIVECEKGAVVAQAVFANGSLQVGWRGAYSRSIGGAAPNAGRVASRGARPQANRRQNSASSPPHLLPDAVDEQYEQFVQDPKYTVAHPYPATKLMFLPDKDTNMPDLLASSSDFLRLWRITDDGIVLQKVLNNVRRGT